jgi:hypothetical protein
MEFAEVLVQVLKLFCLVWLTAASRVLIAWCM